MRKCFALLMLMIFLLAEDANTQPYYFTHYQVEDGLSNNAVLCIMQDQPGFMWFGTRDGLNRFDGLSYKIFRNNPSDKKSIGSNAIMSLSEDSDKKIWTGTEKGLFVFDELTESFTQLKYAGNGSVQSVKCVGDDIYYITLYVLYRYNKKTKNRKTFDVNSKEVTGYNVLKDGSLWVTTSSGIVYKYNAVKDSFDLGYDMFSHSGYVVSKWVQSVYEVEDGKLLVGTSNQGLKLLDIKTATYKDLLTLNADKTDIIVRDIIAVNKNEYWIATQSGIYILNLYNSEYYNLRKQYEDPYSLSDNIVQTLCMDKQGGIWAGTYFGGVNYYPKQALTFKKYFPKVNENSISGNAVSEIHEDKDGLLWIGTEDAGLNKFNPQTGNFINFNPSDKQSISYSNIHGLLVDGDTVWAGTYLHGLDLLNSNGKRLHNYNTLNSSIGSNFIGAMLKTKRNEIIAATDKGAYKYITSTNNFERINALPKAFFRALCEDDSGNIWGGTYGDGIYIYNPQTNTAKHYFFAINKNQSIACNIINYIFYDEKGIVWFATEGGLCAYEPAKNNLHIYTSKDGLPADVVYAILEDDHNDLWISTSKGLARFTPATTAVRTFNKSQGLLTDQFNYRSACKDDKGNMYFGSVKGMISFNPDSISNSNFIPPVYITGFQVYNKELPIDSTNSPLKQSITFTKKITLAHNQSSFSIDFSALDYSAPSNIAYAYKMNGLDKSWTDLPINRKAYFTELKPGNYTFVVKRMDDNNEDTNLTKLNIEILPPFWQTWWAYILYAVLVLLVTFFVIKFFYDRSRARNKRRLETLAFEKEKENYEDKINFFTNVAHEIKTPLTLIKGPMENIMDQIDEVPSIKGSIELMSRNTDRLMQLANQLLDFRKIEMNGFHLSFIKTNISDLLSDNYIRFKPVAEQKNIHLDVKAVENLSAYADEEALNKIFSNLVDNAVKYAAKTVSIKLDYANNAMKNYRLVVANDGFIIPEENKEMIFESFYRIKETSNHAGTGIGLTLSRSLAEMHGGTLVLDTSAKNINVFVLTLPVHPNINNNSH